MFVCLGATCCLSCLGILIQSVTSLTAALESSNAKNLVSIITKLENIPIGKFVMHKIDRPVLLKASYSSNLALNAYVIIKIFLRC